MSLDHYRTLGRSGLAVSPLALGTMTFDSADMASMAANGTLEGVILHEMGHVLGLGTLWEMLDLISPANKFHYIGSNAVAGYRTVARNSSATYVPLETEGGEGTAGGHWSESIFKTELMTGYVSRSSMPISLITIGSLADMGYTVDYAQANSFFI